MNSPKNREDVNTLDLSLKHTLKNWAARSQPPADGKTRLFNAVTQRSFQGTPLEASKFSRWISMTLSERFVEIYLDSFKTAPYFSLQPGGLIINYPNSVLVR
jgi:hypothetical protein